MATSKKICVLGNYSGRNAGDAAILAGLLRDVSSRYENVEFLVPTLSPQFIRRTFGDYPVTPVSLLPWKGCLKLLGLPAWNAMRSSDLILVTDAILFDRGLFNPLHNYLSTLAWLIPRAKKQSIPVVLYNVSLGPVRTRAGSWCLRRVVGNSDLLILRDEESRKALDFVGTNSAPVLKGGDSALSAPACSRDQVERILRVNGFVGKTTPRVGINLNAYGDAFIRNGRSGFSQEKFLSIMARTAEWIKHELKAEVWLFGTQYMDVKILRDFKKTIPDQQVHLFSNQEYGYAELLGLLSEIDLLIGMRTHALILASSVGTPVIGIVNYPKTYGYLERIGMEGQAIPIQELELGRLQDLIRVSWEQRSFLRQSILRAVERERDLACQAVNFLKPYLGDRYLSD